MIDPVLLDLAALLKCLQCGAADHAATSDGVTCRACGHLASLRDGVLHLSSADEDPAIDRERRAVLELESASRPATATDFSMRRLLDAPGPLRTALSSLPYDDGSAYFRDNEYFRNVSQFAATFDAVLAWLDLPPGSRVLDVGADLTWSTARLAARGSHAVAIDINHHLAASQIFREQGLAFAAVNVDMHAPGFADGAFDAVTAFNALHHTHRLDALVANLSRVLRPGGRLGFIEPYWIHEQNRATFGVAQIDAGINENVYRLEEWHQTFVNHGLELVVAAAGPSFHGVYEKRAAALPARALTVGEAYDDLFSYYYHAWITAPPRVAGAVRPGASLEIPVTVGNRSQIGWHPDSQIFVFLSYHLYRIEDGAETSHPTLVAFDNARTPLPGPVNPGTETVIFLRVTAPPTLGIYVLDVDLVHEGVTWFADRGSSSARIELHVG